MAPELAPMEVPLPEEGRAGGEGVHRGGVRRVERAGRGLWVRRYLHGGLLGTFLRDRFLTSGRGRAELDLLLELARRRVPVPEPAFLAWRRVGLFVRQRLGTWEVEGRCLQPVLAEGPELRRPALAAAGRAVRRLHDAGVLHGDLHLSNLLWDGEEVIALDFDRAVDLAEAGGPDAEARWRELLRLLRSARKRRGGLACTATDALRLLGAYAGGEARWRDELRGRLERFERAVGRHRLLWSKDPPKP